jgi:hypothetical protein
MAERPNRGSNHTLAAANERHALQIGIHVFALRGIYVYCICVCYIRACVYSTCRSRASTRYMRCSASSRTAFAAVKTLAAVKTRLGVA